MAALDRLLLPQAPQSGRKINFQALGAGTAEGGVVGKNDVAAVLADHPSIRKNAHRVEDLTHDAVGTTRLFFCHGQWSPGAGAIVPRL
jgi:hypothetical protein